MADSLLVVRQAPSADKILVDLLSHPFEASFTSNAFWASLATSLGFSILMALIFSALRPYNSTVYAPKLRHADEQHAPPVVGRGFFAWVKPTLKVREMQLVEKIGLDATIFLRFTRMCRNLFLLMSLVGLAILLPINVTGNNSQISMIIATYDKNAALAPLEYLTLRLVAGPLLWAHVACSWIFDLLIAYFLWTNYRAVVRLKTAYFQGNEYRASLHSRTLMITHIPKVSRTDEGVTKIVSDVKVVPAIPRCVIGRNVKELPELISQHGEAVRRLESILAKYLKNPDNLPAGRPTCKPYKADASSFPKGQKVDAIEYLSERIRTLEQEILTVRESVDKRNAMPYGFASFDTIQEAHSVAYAAKRTHPSGTRIKLAPRPSDIIWDNLPLSKASQRRKRILNNTWIGLMTLVYVVPNALIAVFLSNLSNLGKVWPAFQTVLNGQPQWWAGVQGVLSPALTSLIYLLLPIVFRRLSVKAGDTTKSARDKQVTRKLYAFFIFNNLIIFSLFSSIWSFVTTVIRGRGQNETLWEAITNAHLASQLVEAFIQVSSFWVTYLLQRNLGAAVDLSQVVNLVWTWCARTFFNPTPRQLIEWTAPPWFDYASYYNYFLFYATVALCFAALQPIVVPITALYFVVDSVLKKYLLMYVFITKTESGGQMWRILFNRLIFAAILANIMVGLVVYARGNTNLQAWLMVPPIILMLAFKLYCSRKFDDKITFFILQTAAPKDQESLAIPNKPLPKRNERLGSRFGHPALHRSLITPMVHAKATHVLGNVYRGRLNSYVSGGGDGLSSASQDVPLNAMSQNQPGKAVLKDTPFEVVQEDQLDFAFYKDRDEFGDDHGGGDIYGHQIDLISERPDTPRSFFGSSRPVTGGGSPQSSRESSPVSLARSKMEMDGTTYPADYHHPAFRSESPSALNFGDIGSSRLGIPNPYEDESTLLAGAAAPPSSTTPGAGNSSRTPRDREPLAQPHDPLAYDYFRGRP
ncbi:MAG: hypothetical protein M1829_006094 [Trizodia sp. TS-e1964]|nr:MAG: hypothetical protein M1829_006094 [Trizodia sp. TS-e1964]